jgi:regulator of nucleoside diphosphate kinase
MSTKPKITISSRDAERLESLLDGLGDTQFPGRSALIEELDRANIVAPEDMPPNIVTMNSTVRFRQSDSGNEFSLTLVYPKDKRDSDDTLSILAPVGGALLGLKEGDEIEWPKPGGGVLSVQIIEVTYQPERAGEYHR